MIDHGLLMLWYFRRPSYSLPPQVQAPTEEETSAAAEAAAQREKEQLKKRRRPTLLTGYGGATGEPQISNYAQGGATKLGQ